MHIYLTVPFLLSWSLFNALACGALVVASDTAPVRELIRHGENGLVADFFDVDRLAELSIDVLCNPQQYRHLGEQGVTDIHERYSVAQSLPRLLELYQGVCSK